MLSNTNKRRSNVVSLSSWANAQQRFGSNSRGNNESTHQKIIAAIDEGLKQNDLAHIKIAASALCENPEAAARVARHFKSKVSYRHLSFQWFPEKGKVCGKLVIRNQFIALVVNGAQISSIESLVMTAHEKKPFRSLAPEIAL
jgi:hypothetical protein